MKTRLLFILPAISLTITAFAHETPAKGSISASDHLAKDQPRLAKVSPSQAIESVKKVQTGRILSTSLEDEDGILVYAIQVLDNGSKKHEIMVDAGTGKVLPHESDEPSGNDRNESEE